MGKSKVLDTNVLIRQWHRFSRRQKRTSDAMRLLADELIELQGTNLIFSPVLIEFLAGARSKEEMDLYDAYLAPFKVLDQGDIPRTDWEKAKRYARWVRDGRERKLGDCLIQSIADRLNCDVITSDPDFRPRMPPR